MRHNCFRTRARNHLAAFALSLMTVGALVGCASGNSADSPDAIESPTQTQEAPEVTAENELFIGTWSSDEPGEPHLTFGNDGTVRGSDGCNGISTTFTSDGEIAVLKPFASTLKACSGVDDWLRGVSSVSLDGDIMDVSDSEGEAIGTLQREAD